MPPHAERSRPLPCCSGSGTDRKTVALVSAATAVFTAWLECAGNCSGDAGRCEVTAVAGVTAASAAAAVLGAPLMHDFAVISLSDCMTPLEQIYRRVALAAEADFVICLYNPKSRSRTAYLAEAAKLIQQHRKPETPVGIVRNAGREGERAWITTLEKLPEEPVDMFCVVLVGNSQTYVQNGKMITPRGYCVRRGKSR
ncbi:MAG: SAM-dependent methyltransferase [Ruminococcus callidus]